jgi:quercetin dioxygenase-like cupin family protein
MAQDVSALLSPVAEDEVPWLAHPRFAEISMRQLLTSRDNPLASVSRVRVPPGGVIGWHHHATQTETVYVLSGQSTLTLGESPVRFCAGHIVAIPPTIQHTLVNEGAEPVDLLCFFTPPVV